MRDFEITDAKKGAAFPVRVASHAQKNEIAGRTDDAFEVRLAASSVGGKANDMLVDFLARKLDVRKSQIEIVAGETSPAKMISVVGISPTEVEKRLLG